MKVFYGVEELDPNSNKTKKLYIKDVYLGDYNYGQYSRLQIILQKCEGYENTNVKSIAGMNQYVNGMIYQQFGINAWELDDPKSIYSIIKEKANKSFNEWLYNKLDEQIKDAENELLRLRNL